MSLLLEIPSRIQKMLLDASEHVTAAYTEVEYDIDGAQRPAWVIVDSGGQYLQGEFSEGLAQFQETIGLELYGQPFGAGFEHEYFLQVKNIANDTVRYFMQHQQLDMANDRGLENDRLRSLPGVLHISLTREPVTLYTAPDGESKIYGVKMAITVTCRLKIQNSMY